MDQPQRYTPNAAIYARHVRDNAGSVLIAAALLCLFGYWGLAVPTGSSRFAVGNLLVVYAMRIGGPLLGAIGLACLLGKPVVLMVDGIITTITGAALAIGGGLMISASGGLNPVLCLIFGIVFVRAGVRNIRDYLAMRAGNLRLYTLQEVAPDPGQRRPYHPPYSGADDAGFSQPEDVQPTFDAHAAERLAQRKRASLTDATGFQDDEGDSAPVPPLLEAQPGQTPGTQPPPSTSDEEVPEGFLAALAKKKDPQADQPDD